MKRTAWIALLALLVGATARAQPTAPPDAPTRVLELAKQADFLRARVAGLTDSVARTGAFIEARQRLLSEELAKGSGADSGRVSAMALELLDASMHLEGERLKLWQHQRLLEIGRTSPSSKPAAKKYLEEVAQRRTARDRVIATRAAELAPRVTDPALLERLKQTRPNVYRLLRPVK